MKKIVMNRKGFTLVELLAVIVVLGIIMVIAGGSIMNTIENATVNAYVNSYKLLSKEIKKKIEINSLGLELQQIECNDYDPNTSNDCSTIYDVSKTDYKMVVKKNGFGNYLFTLEGIGKFADVDLTDEIVNGHIGSLNAEDATKDSNSSVTTFFGASGEQLTLTEEEDEAKTTQGILNVGRRINFIINDIVENFETKYTVSSTDRTYTDHGDIKISYNITKIDTNGSGPLYRIPLGGVLDSYDLTQGDYYYVTIRTINDNVSSDLGDNFLGSSNFSVSGSPVSNTRYMNHVLNKYGMMVPKVCYHPDPVSANNYYLQLFFLRINGEEKTIFSPVWDYCNT